MPKVLLSCFDAFGDFQENSSQLVLKELLPQLGQAYTVKSLTLPASYTSAFSTLSAAINEFQPELIVCLAQAASRKQISLERQARNLTSCALADNSGDVISSASIRLGAAEVLLCELPLDSICEADPNLLCVSDDAGSFVCNHLYYQLLHELQDQTRRAILIHLPLADRQQDAVAAFSLPAERMAQAVNKVIAAALAN